MPQQLDLWTTGRHDPPNAAMWSHLEAEQRASVVAALARLIIKTVRPTFTRKTEAKNDEQ